MPNERPMTWDELASENSKLKYAIGEWKKEEELWIEREKDYQSQLSLAQKERDEAVAELRKSGEALEPLIGMAHHQLSLQYPESIPLGQVWKKEVVEQAEQALSLPLMKKVLESGGGSV